MILIHNRNLLEILEINNTQSANVVIDVEGLNVELDFAFYYSHLEQMNYLSGLKKDKIRFLEELEKDVKKLVEHTCKLQKFDLQDDTVVYLDFFTLEHKYEVSLKEFSLCKKVIKPNKVKFEV